MNLEQLEKAKEVEKKLQRVAELQEILQASINRNNREIEDGSKHKLMSLDPNRKSYPVLRSDIRSWAQFIEMPRLKAEAKKLRMELDEI